MSYSRKMASKAAWHGASRLIIAACAGLGLSAAMAQQGANSQQASPPVGPDWTYYPQPTKAPKGAPNIILVLMDDVGFSASTSYGGPIPTPVFDSLAASGLRYTRFHTTAMCSPTRAALLTGRNHHAVGNASISNVSIDAPGYTSVMPDSAATLGRVLRDNGYDTSWFGKNHNIPDWETGPMGPFKRWPIGLGFDYFYGFNGAGADQFNPTIVENINPVRRDRTDDNYIFDRDMTDKMLGWLGAQQAQDPNKPFFLYVAPGAMHGPQQAPADWVAKFKGKFDMGWDKMRDQIFARQKAMGIIPKDARMAPPLPGVPRWDSLPADQKALYAHMMEVAAAQLAFFDDQLGRVIERVRQDGELDNTLVIFINGDNGAALHNMYGSINAYSQFAGIKETPETLLPQKDKFGTEESFGNYPVGWGYALNTPYPWGKTVASQLGGLRVGMVVSWPDKIKDKGGIRTQFSHVIDIAPTIYDVVGITPPATVDGVAQQPIDGISMKYSFDAPKAPSQRREQYFEMLGSRGYYKDGWFAGTEVNWEPWGPNKTDPTKAGWELYNLNEDWSQTRNVAAQYPDKLAELKADFEAAAQKFHVYPLSADFFERLNYKYRPNALAPERTRTYYTSDIRYPAVTFPELNHNWTAEARVKLTGSAVSGPILTQGAKFAGYTLAMENGVPVFTYNPSGRAQERKILRGTQALGAGDHVITAQIAPASEGLTISLLVDGKSQATASIPRVIKIVTGEAMIGHALIDDRTGPLNFPDTIEKVTITSY
ncbi:MULTISPECIES: arylsulfatase [unclassified Sphingobium]|uniref:arylsulfatase n=1 Tax=unclassified Sphingobium TaxID=2611147 RepID=UPI0022244D63|nr:MULTISPECIES: arylsulfatase [unclassified Sphingobium]MCW2396818.1 arylsulfatase [Sphingobium sp. B8D3B]MCW2420335.1 arylsulfatase [Sphingobium sp. B8D3C]